MSASSSRVTIGDATGDDLAELVVTSTVVPGKITIFPGNGSGQFATQASLTPGTFQQETAIGDLNRDGRSDLVAISLTGGEIFVLLGLGGRQVTGNSPLSFALLDRYVYYAAAGLCHPRRRCGRSLRPSPTSSCRGPDS